MPTRASTSCSSSMPVVSVHSAFIAPSAIEKTACPALTLSVSGMLLLLAKPGAHAHDAYHVGLRMLDYQHAVLHRHHGDLVHDQVVLTALGLVGDDAATAVDHLGRLRRRLLDAERLARLGQILLVGTLDGHRPSVAAVGALAALPDDSRAAVV